MDELLLLVSLLVGHLLADFYLQPLSWIKDRQQCHYRSIKLIYHGLLHAFLSLLILVCWQTLFGWGFTLTQPLLLASVVGLSHYAIDLVKSYCPRNLYFFVLDQILHLLVLIWIWLQTSQAWHLTEHFWQHLLNLDTLLLLSAYLIVLRPFSFMISMALKKWHTGDDSSLPSAGHVIGLIERTLILTFVLLEQYAGIGFLLAAKSIFRFGDLTRQQDRQLTEYVMLGTLLSTTMTILLGLGVRALINWQ